MPRPIHAFRASNSAAPKTKTPYLNASAIRVPLSFRGPSGSRTLSGCLFRGRNSSIGLAVRRSFQGGLKGLDDESLNGLPVSRRRRFNAAVKSLRDANLERLCILHCYDCLKYFAYMSEYAPMLH